MASRTLYHMFQESVRRHGSRPAVGFKATPDASSYTYYTYAELDERVRAFRRGLDALGLKTGDTLAMLSENRVEWAIADLAAQSLGICIVAPYATLPAPQIRYILQDSRARAVIVSDARQADKIQEIRHELPCLEHVIAMEGDPETLRARGLIPFTELPAIGQQSGRTQEELDRVAASVDPDAVATLLYTSGTTGDPKGAMLTHNNLLQCPDDVMEEPVGDLTPQDIFLSFLPLSHITERAAGYYLPLRAGACIVYSRGLAALPDEITRTVRPTVMLCVPRLWENMHSKFLEALARAPEKKRKLVTWALATARKAVELRASGRQPGPILRMSLALADRLVLSQIRQRLTGGRMRYAISGGAPLDPETTVFFLSIGVQMLEGYGLSEAGIMFVNRPGRQRPGTVGLKLRQVEVKIAPDGEILMRGQGLMKGYLNRPEDTAEAIDAEGWFHTGDIGELSPDGYLRITDRKKDLIVLTNGKKVAPQAIEIALKHSPYIAEAVLLGDRQATVMALLVPALDALRAWAEQHDVPSQNTPELLEHPEVYRLYRSEIDRLTPHLADYEKIRRFRLIEQPFSIEGGELTPTLKVKRHFVARKYADLIATMTRS
ncbi:MAG: long-chain fatty acid--CoA ligase [Chloroherpetonaceae bacterium]|nr:long-chain fatty acid--CoA ligase [Chthonomonadaceae bacterium]MDW8206921.1 long-chain fatty acid--CoA ligase [Chloroherpetonaceae bacterium]